MPKALIITEKPSVARDIVAALGGFKTQRGNAYWESDEYLCSFAVGHIFTLFQPEDIDPALKSWKLSLLPILPKTFQLKPLPEHKLRIEVLAELLRRSDVDCVINACDAAREGELIFREIVEYHESKKRVRRLWLQSMTPEAIRKGFSLLREGAELDGLGNAAHCRAHSDWLIGMNATRAFSDRLRSRGERSPWSVGRVQTPTLALLVERELKILGHRPQPFFKVLARFDAKSHKYEGTYFDAAFKADERFPEKKDDRIFGKPAAQAIIDSLAGQRAEASETREESLRHAPYLFHLTGLQKYMASRYKWSAKRTLESAQRCYEQHKVLTYPRTSAQCLPSDYRGEVDRLIAGFGDDPLYGVAAQYLQKNGLKNDKRTFNDEGVSDHFAIIPTGKSRELAGDDGKLYDAVVRRFLATFFPAAVYDKVKRITRIAGHAFRTGPVETLVVPGWLSVYDKQTEDRPEKELPPLVPGEKNGSGAVVKFVDATLKDETTKPPPRINEAGLLSLMEHAGRQVESEELAQALMSAEGLGTAATRADIIQNLKIKEYVDDALRPTFKGIHLIETLKKVKAERLTSPELTARLELELSEVESGKRTRAAFMSAVADYTRDVVEAARQLDWTRIFPDQDPLGACQKCKSGEVFERPLGYSCRTNCGFEVPKDLYGRYIDRGTVQWLLAEGATGDLEGFKSRNGKDLKAILCVNDGQLGLIGGDDKLTITKTQEVKAGAHSVNRGGPRHVLSPCPVHKDAACSVIETRGAYVCELRLKAFQAGEQNPIGFMAPKVLCQRETTEAEVLALIQNGVTPELSGFVSKKGNRFAAKLVLTPGGGFVFEFTPFTSDRTSKPAPTKPTPAKKTPTRKPRSVDRE